MDDQTTKLFRLCSQVEFGEVKITEAERVFYHDLNQQIPLLCKSLPESLQTEAMLLFLKDPRGTFSENLEFFRHYAKPSWSIIYGLAELGHLKQRLSGKDRQHAIEAHAMAMFLHALDDHLHDGELALNHLTLLIRSQGWLKMQNALLRLVDGLDECKHIISGFLNEYYTSIGMDPVNNSLDQYCDLFRSQMATAYIVPGILIKKISADSGFYSNFLSAYGSFGIAWRLLDDLNDLRQDMAGGRHSAVYCCLSNELKTQWNTLVENRFENTSDIRNISNYILDCGIIDQISARIFSELDAAAKIYDSLGLNGLANEFRTMSKSFKSRFWRQQC